MPSDSGPTLTAKSNTGGKTAAATALSRRAALRDERDQLLQGNGTDWLEEAAGVAGHKALTVRPPRSGGYSRRETETLSVATRDRKTVL